MGTTGGNSLHRIKDGRVFQMRDSFTNKPMRFRDGKHNYRKKDYDALEIGQTMEFRPLYGNNNPVYTTLIRLA